MMKKLFVIILILCATASTMGQGMKLMLNHKAYCTDKIQPYIEFTIRVGGNTVVYALNENKRYEAEVLINVDVIQNDEVKYNLHYILVSETFADSVVDGRPDFGDIRNLPVENGDYYLSFSFKDLHGDTAAINYIDYISVHFPKDSVCTSGIDLLSEVRDAQPGDFYTRYGLSMTPLFFMENEQKKVMLLKDSEDVEYILDFKEENDKIHFKIVENKLYAPFTFEGSFTMEDFIKRSSAFKSCNDLKTVIHHLNNLFNQKKIALNNVGLENERYLVFTIYDISEEKDTEDFGITLLMTEEKDKALEDLCHIQNSQLELLKKIKTFLEKNSANESPFKKSINAIFDECESKIFIN